jgi:hypothetical protein
MKYELKIEHSEDSDGSIDLFRLSTIADSLKKIAEGALLLRLKGLSKAKKSFSLTDALKVTLTGVQKGSTILCLESEKFEKTLPAFQTDLFRLEYQKDLHQKTPISLFVESFREALENPHSSELLDKPLLKDLLTFKKSFLSDNEIFSITNEKSIDGLTLIKSDFKNIQITETEIPSPEPVIVSGRIEELKYSNQRVKILTKEGLVDAFLSESFIPQDITSWWGKEATVTGTLHHKPGKRYTIEIERIFDQEIGDDFFSKKPKHENLEDQITRQIAEGKDLNPLKFIVGTWPGDESDEEFEDLLKSLD